MMYFVYGNGHLAETLSRAAFMRGMQVGPPDVAEVLFVAADVLDHAELDSAHNCFEQAMEQQAMGPSFNDATPVVLVSQVPPGTTRVWAAGRASVFYQVDTIIVRQAVARAYAPEQFVVGCTDPTAPLPLAYQEYLAVHDCPILQMSYESAELAKCAINYVLTKQIEIANTLALACEKAGADYEDVRAVLHNDARIGPWAYLRPGAPNQHLLRDVTTINKLLG